MILCTGSQGEPMSALTRMAYHDHPHVAIEEGDTVIISAKPVPGNELRVHDTINRLAKSGAEVLHQEIAPVHVSGHGNAEEIRTILAAPAAAQRHARARRVPHARRAGAAGARRRRPGRPDRPGRERLRRRARGAASPGSSTSSRWAARSSTVSGSGTCRTSPSATAATSPRTASSSSSPRSARRTARDRGARGDLARLRRDRLAARRGRGTRPSGRSRSASRRTSPS